MGTSDEDEAAASEGRPSPQRGRGFSAAALLLVLLGGGYFFWKQDREVRASDASRVRTENVTFLAELEEIRSGFGPGLRVGPRASEDGLRLPSPRPPARAMAAATAAAYAAAFERRFGSAKASAERLKASGHAPDFADNVGLWCWIRKVQQQAELSAWAPLDRLMREIDPQDEAVRDALLSGDADELLASTKTGGADLRPALAAQAGLALAELGRVEQAIAFLEAQQRRAPDDFWIRLRLADVAARHGDGARATAHLEAAVTARPKHAAVRTRLGALLSDRLGRHDEAIEVLQGAVALSPDSVLAQGSLSRALSRSGDHEGAVAAARRGVEANPGSAYAHAALGAALSGKGELEGALAAAHQALELDPQYAEAQAAAGVTLLRLGRVEESVAALRKAIELGAPSASFNLALLHDKRGEVDAAIAAYGKAIELDPEDHVAHANLGGALARKGDVEGAQAALRKALTLAPDFARGYVRLGAVLCDNLQRYDEAVAAFRKALELDPKLVIAQTNIGIALRKKGDMDGAVAAYRKAIALDATYIPAHASLGALLCDEMESYDEAIAAFRAALAIDPKLVTAQFNIGIANLKKGDLQAAVDALQKCIEMEPKDLRAYLTLGGLLVDVGQQEAGLKFLRKVLVLDPQNADARNILAQVEQREAQRAALAARLPAMLAGEQQPANWQEALFLAELGMSKRKAYAGVLRLYRQAFVGNDELTAHPGSGHRYNGACAAALAGEAWHRQAVAWLRADLDAWDELLEEDPKAVAGTLALWRKDPDLAAIRDAADLPEKSKTLWADVDELLREAEALSK